MTAEIQEQLFSLDRKIQEALELIEKKDFPWWEMPVLSTARAIQYTGFKSETAFRRRMKIYGVTQCDDGLWPRTKIDAALNKISRNRFKSSRGRKPTDENRITN